MKLKPSALAALLALLPLAGCAVGGGPGSGTSTSAANLSGNWQFSTVNTTPSASYNLALVGALASSGANVTGAFRFSNLTPGNGCGALNQVVNVTGKVDTSNPLLETLSFTSASLPGSTITGQFTLSPVAVAGTLNSVTGTLQITGTGCTFSSAQAVGIEYPAVTGTYSGTVAPTANIPGNVTNSGTATLKATQAATANPDGQFAVTGSLSFVSGSCTVTSVVSGTTSGPIVTLNAQVATGSTSVVSLVALQGPTLPAATTQLLQQANLIYIPAPCQSSLTTIGSYTGTLTSQ